MARRTSSYSRKRYPVRRRTRRKPNVKAVTYKPLSAMTVAQAAYGAYQGYNVLKGIINSELKRYDVAGQLNPSNAGSIFILNDIAAGDDVNNRTGNSILAKYLTFNYTVSALAAATTTNLRILIVVDTENIGANPTISQILQNTLITGSLTAPINSDNTARFTVLMDRHHSFTNTGQLTIQRKNYKKLDFHIRFTGTLSSNFQKNSIYVLAVSDQTTNTPTLDYNSRIAYYDN